MGIQSDYVNANSLRLWAGVPSPIDRWRMLKVLYLYWLVTDKNRNRSYPHQWLDKGWLDDGILAYDEMIHALQSLLRMGQGCP